MAQNLIKLNITLYNGSIEGIDQKMMAEFPVISESGWRFLRSKIQQNLSHMTIKDQKMDKYYESKSCFINYYNDDLII